MLDQMRSALTAPGADPVTASRQAYGAAFGMLQRQAAHEAPHSPPRRRARPLTLLQNF